MAYEVSVFIENQVGHLERVTSVLKDAGINILTMNLNHTASGWGIVNLLVSRPEKACLLLTGNGISAALRRIAVLAMDDSPGALDDLLKKIASAGINFTTAYGRSGHHGGKAWFVIDVNDIPEAEQKMVDARLVLLPDDTIYALE
jgi:hypothetical protein